MKDGRIVAEGASGEVITEQLVREVFGLDSRVVPDPVSGTPLVIPLGRHHAPSEPATSAPADVPTPTLELVP
jgi:iron complex transport system ATP-binding protein